MKNGISNSLKVALYWFIENLYKGLLENESWDFDSNWFENETLDWDQYQTILKEPHIIKTAITVWSNNVETDSEGQVLNSEYAEFRAFQSIRPYFDKNFSREDIKPPFQDWEVVENET